MAGDERQPDLLIGLERLVNMPAALPSGRLHRNGGSRGRAYRVYQGERRAIMLAFPALRDTAARGDIHFHACLLFYVRRTTTWRKYQHGAVCGDIGGW